MISQELSHGQVVVEYHRKRGNLHELQNCLVEIEKISVREHILTADGRTRALVRKTGDRFRKMLRGDKHGGFGNEMTLDNG
jgi:hypothetical protein